MWALGVIMFELVSNNNPWSIDVMNTNFSKTCKTITNNAINKSAVMSETYFDLVSKLLDRDVQKRLSPSEALQHKLFDPIRKSLSPENLFPVGNSKPHAQLASFVKHTTKPNSLYVGERANRANTRRDHCAYSNCTLSDRQTSIVTFATRYFCRSETCYYRSYSNSFHTHTCHNNRYTQYKSPVSSPVAPDRRMYGSPHVSPKSNIPNNINKNVEMPPPHEGREGGDSSVDDQLLSAKVGLSRFGLEERKQEKKQEGGGEVSSGAPVLPKMVIG